MTRKGRSWPGWADGRNERREQGSSGTWSPPVRGWPRRRGAARPRTRRGCGRERQPAARRGRAGAAGRERGRGGARPLPLRRLGRGGSLLVATGCGRCSPGMPRWCRAARPPGSARCPAPAPRRGAGIRQRRRGGPAGSSSSGRA